MKLVRYFSSYIRNFCIVAHIDHGKSTLADRFLELTGTKLTGSQVLDKLEVEKTRGITVKAQTVTMEYTLGNCQYQLNLIDTPGHVDFSYEVSRSLRAAEGAILLVDATAGVQAQTYSTFFQALDANLEIIPAVNKIDHPSAITEVVADQIYSQFDLEDPFKVSAANGKGVQELLEAVIARVPPPKGNPDSPLRAFLFDSWYHPHKGVVCLFKIVDGSISKANKVKSLNTQKVYEIKELGLNRLDFQETQELQTGQVGYIILNMQEVSEAMIGDTFCMAEEQALEPFPGFQEPKCMVFAGVFPEDPGDYDVMQKALAKYNLEDRSLIVQKDISAALGNGFRCGFLGLLHMEIFKDRLNSEHQISVITTSPSVPYKVELKSGELRIVDNANDLPDKFHIRTYYEPIVETTIIVPLEYMGEVLNFCLSRRAFQKEISSIDSKTTLMSFEIPLSEIITDFFDALKSFTKGMATLDYEHRGYNEADLGKMTVLLNGESVDALNTIVHRSDAYNKGRAICQKLKELLPRQQFELAIQASFNGKVIARQTIKAYRKDVTAKLYGGDQTRKDKLLKKQKAGKKRMRNLGNIEVESSTFAKLLSNSKN